ncbi:PepSY domain-containing protein [Brevundimonas faecalis]|uniref:Peptidase n=1 Tax=Brevundimonas faecalis TaxID=947378 RepID=A0ABV2RCL2_9CAUL
MRGASLATQGGTPRAPKTRGPLFRALMVIHRYLGVATGVLMTVWCLSGFVMMYQGYPALTEPERLAGLQPLDLHDCCVVPELDPEDAAALSGFRIEMLDGRPILRAAMGRGSAGKTYDLTTGLPFGDIDADMAGRMARRQAEALEIWADPAWVRPIRQDQWTVQFAKRHQPLYQVRFDDPRRSDIYVSGVNGQAFQHTNARERLLGWLGAVPHWLYPTVLRQNGKLWNDVVVWTSVAGSFLTVTGLYVGVVHFGRRRNGRMSPFRGLWFWHHMIGLIFGVLTLTWVFSGLMTMNPWGLLEGGGDRPVRQVLTGEATGEQFRQALTDAARITPDAKTAQLVAVPIAGQVRLAAVHGDGSQVRLAPTGLPDPVTEAEVRSMLAPLKPVSIERLTREDAYYYGRKGDRPALPVWRAVLSDAQKTRVYLDADTGQVRRVVDRDGRWSRWIRNGLHGLDFDGLRTRPIWDLVVLPLLFGVTLVCATGAWMSFRRIGRDISGLSHALTAARTSRRRRSPFPQSPADHERN